MPCQDSYNQDRDFQGTWKSNDNAEVENLRKRLNHVANLLCTVMNAVEENSAFDSGLYEILMHNAELHEWWLEHKEYDKNRK